MARSLGSTRGPTCPSSASWWATSPWPSPAGPAASGLPTTVMPPSSGSTPRGVDPLDGGITVVGNPDAAGPAGDGHGLVAHHDALDGHVGPRVDPRDRAIAEIDHPHVVGSHRDLVRQGPHGDGLNYEVGLGINPGHRPVRAVGHPQRTSRYGRTSPWWLWEFSWSLPSRAWSTRSYTGGRSGPGRRRRPAGCTPDPSPQWGPRGPHCACPGYVLWSRCWIDPTFDGVAQVTSVDPTSHVRLRKCRPSARY